MVTSMSTIDAIESALTADESAFQDITCHGDEIEIDTDTESPLVYHSTHSEDLPYREVFEDALGITHNGPVQKVRGISASEDGSELFVSGFSPNWVFYTIKYKLDE